MFKEPIQTLLVTICLIGASVTAPAEQPADSPNTEVGAPSRQEVENMSLNEIHQHMRGILYRWTDDEGNTALHVLLARALEREEEEILTWLIARHGGPVHMNKPDAEGMTPLARAVEAGHKPFVTALINSETDPSLETPIGTPVDIARQDGHHDILEVLERALENPAIPRLPGGGRFEPEHAEDKDPRLKDLIHYYHDNGIELVPAADYDHFFFDKYEVVQPDTGDWRISILVGVFPDTWSRQQIQAEFRIVNLAFHFNSTAAMALATFFNERAVPMQDPRTTTIPISAWAIGFCVCSSNTSRSRAPQAAPARRSSQAHPGPTPLSRYIDRRHGLHLFGHIGDTSSRPRSPIRSSLIPPAEETDRNSKTPPAAARG